MQTTILDGVPDHQRLQVLKDSADSVEETSYFKPLTQDELEAKREEYLENQIKLTTLQDELEILKDDYKIKTKPLSVQNRELLIQVKTRQMEIHGTLYHLANHETGFMETYNEFSELISTRRLRPNEKQKNIFSLKASNQ